VVMDMRDGLSGRSKLQLCQGEGQGDWSLGNGLRLFGTATENSRLESLAILGLGVGGQLGHSFLGEEPWATVT